jgi:hypothetical protein
MDLAKRPMGAALGENSVAMNVLHDNKLTLYQYLEVHGMSFLRP